jgi:proprotein convertase subtilisin/kexin type 5
LCNNTAIECTACSSILFLNINSKTCSASCPVGFYGDANSRQCSACDARCASCTGPSNTECGSCTASYTLAGNTCSGSVNCLNNQYFNAATSACLNCGAPCLTCNGPLSSNCLSCASSLFFYNFACLVQC